MSAIIIDEKIVHYEVLGRGKPILFLHGWLGSWRYWIPAMQSASASFRAYALDLWGFGDTAKETEKYGLEQQIELLDSFLNEMGIGKVALIGHGLGGIVSLMYAAKHSFVVDRIMLVGLPIHASDIDGRLKTESPDALMSWMLSQEPTTEAARAEVPKSDGEAIKISLQEIENVDILNISKELDTANLLVHGQRDPAIKVPDLSTNGDLPSSLQHIIFDESGHFPMLDQPNKFNRLVNDFLDLSSGESPQRLQLKEEWKRRVR